MALKRYQVVVDGVRTTLLLNDDDAKRLGVFEEPKKADDAPATKKRTAANKSRTARNKG